MVTTLRDKPHNSDSSCTFAEPWGVEPQIFGEDRSTGWPVLGFKKALKVTYAIIALT